MMLVDRKARVPAIFFVRERSNELRGDTASDGSDLQPQGSAEPQDRPDAVFLGDKGALPLDTRRVLVQLLLGPSVDATRQSKLWPVLLRDEAVIASRLHELFLELVIDRDHRGCLHAPSLVSGPRLPDPPAQGHTDVLRVSIAVVPTPTTDTS